ncbi:F-box protein At2g39490-like [Coffea eugenioides]|uniref:F-box protein At2g39490-like n=1 Tax=Coffea eugenioides TaxID=49369 RepID=UPI000F604AE7|nr:F-box protein At2g39490-like [Coffea eugenioides]
MEQRLDLISGLPHDVLLLIVSMIPLKEAIRTAILSNAWRSLWTPSQVKLELGSAHDRSAREKISQIIGAFSMCYDYPEKLKLCLHSVDHTKQRAEYPRFEDESFAIVTKGAQGELHFDCSGGREKWNSTEFNLILETGRVICPRFSYIKSLQLRSVTHVSGNLAADLFSGCQILESLRLEKCRGLRKIDISTNDCLKSLTIMDCSNINSIKVSAPRLEAFSYGGILPNIVQLNGTPHLNDAILNFKDGLNFSDFHCEDVLNLLSSIRDVETLTISGWLLEWLCTAGVIFGRLEFKFSKLKELVWIDSVMDARKRDSLACFLNMTPSLERLFVKIDRDCSPIPSPFFQEYWHEPHLWMGYADVKCNGPRLMYLKSIEIAGFTSKENEVLLMDLLLHKAVNLKDMIVISPDDETHSAWRVRVTPRSQLNYVLRGNQNHRLLPSPSSGYSLYVLTQCKRLGLRLRLLDD